MKKNIFKKMHIILKNRNNFLEVNDGLILRIIREHKR